jgi:hypothetical protein
VVKRWIYTLLSFSSNITQSVPLKPESYYLGQYFKETKLLYLFYQFMWNAKSKWYRNRTGGKQKHYRLHRYLNISLQQVTSISQYFHTKGYIDISVFPEHDPFSKNIYDPATLVLWLVGWLVGWLFIVLRTAQ